MAGILSAALAPRAAAERAVAVMNFRKWLVICICDGSKRESVFVEDAKLLHSTKMHKTSDD
jgi:hypothetical protein